MLVFTGQYERTIDSKNRIQMPSGLRAAIDPPCDGTGIYITLGEEPRTLSIFTEKEFEALAKRIPTEQMAGLDAVIFERQFYALASRTELDKQGRFVLPERLRRKARLGGEIYLIGQKNRIEVWDRARFDGSLGIDWEGDGWHKWRGFIRSSFKDEEQGPGKLSE